MRKLSVGVLIMVIFLFTSCNTNTINDETSSSPVISGLENNETTETETNDSNNYIELPDANRTHKSAFNNNSLILPYGRLEYFLYNNYHRKSIDIHKAKFYELVNEIETSFFYDSHEQFLEFNPSFPLGSNLGTVIYFGISNDEYETTFSISAGSSNRVFIYINDETPVNYQSYITVNDKLVEKVKEISGWRQVDPDQINVQRLATIYFGVDDILNIKQGKAMEYEHYTLDTTEFALLLKQFCDEKKADGAEIRMVDTVIEIYLEDGTSCYCVVDLYTGLLALEQQLYKFDDEFEFIYTNMINAKK